MLPISEFAILDKNAQILGIKQSVLMENAGKEGSEIIREIANKNKFKKILIFCGLGNNGGDGFVIARYLHKEFHAEIILLGKEEEIKSKVAKDNFKKIKGKVKITKISKYFEGINNLNREGQITSAKIKENVKFENENNDLNKEDFIINSKKLSEKISSFDLIIDAMLGVGIKSKLKEPYFSVVKEINKSKKFIVAIDVPTGFLTQTAIKPNLTITFHAVKEGMSKENSGTIIICDIGIPKTAEIFCNGGEFLPYLIPKENSHKGDNGRVLIVGGGVYPGAPTLAGFSAYRIGVDLVRIATPKKTWQIIASYSPNFIVYSLSNEILVKEDVEEVLNLAEKVDCVLIGCGLGDAEETKIAIKEIIKNCKKPMVIDANAIEVCSDFDILKGKSGIITPHKEEFRKLTGIDLNKVSFDFENGKIKLKLENPKEKQKLEKTTISKEFYENFKEIISEELIKNAFIVKNLAEKIGFTILLKGKIDIISNGKFIRLNKTGNSAMTVGGTGDVLAGICSGLLAKGLTPFDAARLSAFINGYAGDLAFKEKSYGLLATDVIEKIHEVLKIFLEEK